MDSSQLKTDHVQSFPSNNDKMCSNCRVKFSLTMRKHRCKVCFFNFCDKCSSRQVSRPNIDRPGSHVRACDNCFLCFDLSYQSDLSEAVFTQELEIAHSNGPSNQTDDLERAIQLSLEEEQFRLAKEGRDKRQMEMAQVISVLKPKRLQGIKPSAPLQSREPEQDLISMAASTTKCLACSEKNVDSKINPCGHTIMCYDCAIFNWKMDEQGRRGECLLCQLEVKDIVRI